MTEPTFTEVDMSSTRPLEHLPDAELHILLLAVVAEVVERQEQENVQIN